jgi:hypothetical protein
LGNLHRTENRLDAAREAFAEARDIYRRFVAVAPATYELRLRTVEGNLAAVAK